MYAVIETGGKQYRVEVGTELEVDLLEAEPGTSITLDRVLLVADGDESAIGRPLVADAAVEAEVVRRDRGDKVIAFKYRPKARRRVKKGHRQDLTILRITDVRLNGKSAAAAVRKAEADAKTERQRLEEAAARQAAEDAALAERLAKSSEAKAPTMASAKAEAAPKKGADVKPAAKPRAGASKAAAAKVEPKTPRAKTPRAKTQSGAADAKPSTTRAKADPSTPKPRTKKDE